MDNLMPIEQIEPRIFLVRGHKVMLDAHLAEMYGVQTRVLNQSVKRNIERFPEDFMFRLTRDEIRGISQLVTSSPQHRNLKYFKSVTVFTEHGVSMLSSVLNSRRAIQVNIQIMRTFAKLRAMVSANKDLTRRLDELEKKYDTQFKVVFDAIRELMTPPKSGPKRIGFYVKEQTPRYGPRRHVGQA